MIDYYLAQLILQDNKPNRKAVLQSAQATYEHYILLVNNYLLLSKSDTKLLERYLEGREEFSLVSSTDSAARRDTKIARFRQEKDLKLKIEVCGKLPATESILTACKYLAQVPQALQNDDAALREIYLTETQLCAHHTFHALDMIAQELKILALMPSASPAVLENRSTDYRERLSYHQDNYSERVDPPLSQLLNRGKTGPILSKDGKPLKPFTLLDSRQQLRDGVFRPDHSLPTMTIDEYLEEEKRRGGMVEGGGEQSGRSAEPDEENYEKVDMETMKAREWDDFTEANPKGSGNTLNRG